MKARRTLFTLSFYLLYIDINLNYVYLAPESVRIVITGPSGESFVDMFQNTNCEIHSRST